MFSLRGINKGRLTINLKYNHSNIGEKFISYYLIQLARNKAGLFGEGDTENPEKSRCNFLIIFKMKPVRIILGMVVLLAATFSAIASVKSYKATNVFYIVGTVGQPDEDCLPFTTQKNCVNPGLLCTDNIPGVGSNIQLYQTRTQIEDTERFHCEVSLREN